MFPSHTHRRLERCHSSNYCTSKGVKGLYCTCKATLKCVHVPVSMIYSTFRLYTAHVQIRMLTEIDPVSPCSVSALVGSATPTISPWTRLPGQRCRVPLSPLSPLHPSSTGISALAFSHNGRSVLSHSTFHRTPTQTKYLHLSLSLSVGFLLWVVLTRSPTQ